MAYLRRYGAFQRRAVRSIPGYRTFSTAALRFGTRTADHVLPAVSTGNRIASAVARYRVVDVLVHAGSTQRVLEAVSKRMEDALVVVDAEQRL